METVDTIIETMKKLYLQKDARRNPNAAFDRNSF